MNRAEKRMPKLFARRPPCCSATMRQTAVSPIRGRCSEALGYATAGTRCEDDGEPIRRRAIAPSCSGGVAVFARFRTGRTRCARAGLLRGRVRSGHRRSHACGRSARSACPAWACRCRKRFRDASARASNIFRNCRPQTTCWNRRVPAIPRPGLVRRRGTSSPRSRRIALRPEAELSWYRAARLIDGREVLLPADLCLRRPPARQEVKPPFPLSTGSAAGTILGRRRLARPARIDRAGRGQPLVAGRQPRQIDPALG